MHVRSYHTMTNYNVCCHLIPESMKSVGLFYPLLSKKEKEKGKMLSTSSVQVTYNNE